MKNELKQDFTRRLSQCNAGEMIVIIYDILFAYLDDVKGAYEEDSHEQMKVAIRRAQNVLDELIHSLNFAYPLSKNLHSLYVFCKNRLDGLMEAEKILLRLYGSFVEVARQDTSEPLMRNTQQVYAGMTYGRASLNENYMDDDQRGFFV